LARAVRVWARNRLDAPLSFSPLRRLRAFVAKSSAHMAKAFAALLNIRLRLSVITRCLFYRLKAPSSWLAFKVDGKPADVIARG
jgi:hypothetical protein